MRRFRVSGPLRRRRVIATEHVHSGSGVATVSTGSPTRQRAIPVAVCVAVTKSRQIGTHCPYGPFHAWIGGGPTGIRTQDTRIKSPPDVLGKRPTSLELAAPLRLRARALSRTASGRRRENDLPQHWPEFDEASAVHRTASVGAAVRSSITLSASQRSASASDQPLRRA